MDFSFSKKNRICRRTDFQVIYQQGVKYEGQYAFMYLMSKDVPPQLGITVSRKVGKAVVRSRIKRHYREAFRLKKNTLRPEAWIVINAKPSALRATGQQLKQDFENLLHKSCLLGDV